MQSSTENPTAPAKLLRESSKIAIAFSALLAAPATLAAQEVSEEQAAAQTETDSETIVVTGQTAVSVATKADIPIIEAPQAISVITDELIEERGYDDAVDALANAAGVNFLFPFGSGQGLAFRGFFANGFRASRLDDARFNFRVAQLDPALVERIDVLKGPASVLYGTADPGGLVNVTTPAPQREFGANITLGAGSFDRYSGSADITGPLNASGSLSARAIVSKLDADSFIDFVDTDRLAALGALTFEPSDRTRVRLKAIYQETDDIVPVINPLMEDGSIPDIPRSRYLGYPIGANKYEQTVLQMDAEQQLSESLKLEARASYVRAKRASQSTYVYVSTGIPASGDGYAYAFYTGDTRTDYAGELRLSYDAPVLGIETRNLVGLEYFNGEATGPGNQDTVFLGTFNIFDPDYEIGPVDIPRTRTFFGEDEFVGVFGQSILEFSDRATLVLGVRWDDLSTRSGSSRNGVVNTGAPRNTTDVSYRIGGSFEIVPNINLYGSYATSFEPSFGIDRDGQRLPPITGRAAEIGLKADLFDGRGLLTVSAYDIAKQNIPTTDPQQPNASIAVGEQTNRGFEAEVQAKPLTGMLLSAAYSYIDAEFTRDNSGLEGNRPNGIPEHTLNLWGSYTLPSGPLEGLGFGSGLYHSGRVFVNNANTATLPAYTRVDASLFYRPVNGPLSISLNVENLFDERYAANPAGFLGYAFVFGAPRSAVLRVGYDF